MQHFFFFVFFLVGILRGHEWPIYLQFLCFLAKRRKKSFCKPFIHSRLFCEREMLLYRYFWCLLLPSFYLKASPPTLSHRPTRGFIFPYPSHSAPLHQLSPLLCAHRRFKTPPPPPGTAGGGICGFFQVPVTSLSGGGSRNENFT